MATPFRFELLTPERALFSGECDEVSMRTDEGEIAFLAHHEDYIAAVDITVVNAHLVSGEREDSDHSSLIRFAVHGGFVHVNDEKVVLLASVAEEGSAIDVSRAQRSLEHAEEEVRTAPAESSPGEGEEGARPYSGAMQALLAANSPAAALRRARVRLEAAGASAAS